MAELPIIRVPLEALSLEELTRVASERLRGEFFVPWEEPFPGGRVCVEATSPAVTPARVRGVATVRAAVFEGRNGLMARLIQLDADSIRVPIGGLASVVRTPAATPARPQKITRPVPLAAEMAMKAAEGSGGEDFEDPTHASPVPAQVAQSMKARQPREKPSVIRRNTPVAVPMLRRPPTDPPPPEEPALAAERPVVTFSTRPSGAHRALQAPAAPARMPGQIPGAATSHGNRRTLVIAVAIGATAVVALLAVLLS